MRTFLSAVVDILSEKTGNPQLAITETVLLTDLVDGPDQLLDLFSVIEGAFGLYIPASDKNRIFTVSNLADFLATHCDE